MIYYTERYEHHMQGEHWWEMHGKTLTPNSNLMMQVVAHSDCMCSQPSTDSGTLHPQVANK